MVRFLRHQSRGFIMIEIPLAVVLVGMTIVSLIQAQGAAYKATYFTTEQSNALILAQTENFTQASEVYSGVIGYIHRGISYGVAPWDFWITSDNCGYTQQPSWWNLSASDPPLLPDNYTGFTVNVTAEQLPLYGDDIQKITIRISHARPGSTIDILELVGYNTRTG